MDIQNTREYKAAKDLERALNDYSWNPTIFAESTSYFHPDFAANFNQDGCCHYKKDG